MPRFKKKPVVISAWKVSELFDTDSLPEPVEDANLRGILTPLPQIKTIRISTLEGVMTALPDDWLIQGVQGEFYPCKPDIFEKTYELCDEAE